MSLLFSIPIRHIVPLALLAGPVLAQRAGMPVPADTLSRQRLGEVVVTATRTEKSLSDVAIPVSVIGAKQLKSMGSLRLGDVLREQTGLSQLQPLPQAGGRSPKLGNARAHCRWHRDLARTI